MWAAPRDDHNRLFFVLMAALIALAWLALWVWGRSPGGSFYAHHDSAAFVRGGSFVLVFIIGWTVMVVAMMLPTSLPLIALFRAVVRQRRDRALLVALLIVGYIGTWALFGGVVYLGGWALYRLIGQSGFLGTNAWVLGAGIIMLAGLYQFTPLKYKCLEKCRSPLGFVTEHWRGSRERSQAFRLGVHHGLFCVGCCWSLMLLMFVVGAGSLGWMLVLGAVMAVEKNVSWGRRIGAPLGVVLLGLGLTLGIASALQSSVESSARIPLAPANGSAVSGTANFTDTSGGMEVRLDVEGLPKAGAMYLAHVHPGSCAGGPAGADENHGRHRDPGDHGDTGEIEHPLTPIVSGTGGNGSSNTAIEGFTVAQLLSRGESYVNVHAEPRGSQRPAVSLACGDLGRRRTAPTANR